MLGRLVLLLLQIVLGWFGANAIMGWIGGSVPGAFSIYVFAIVAAIVVFLVGIIAALLWEFGPTLPLLSEIPWGRVPDKYAVLAGAILGYHIKR